MATSGTYSFTVSRDDIIRTAMLFLGKLDDTEVPTPTETNDLSRILNMIVKQWSGKGDGSASLKTWTRKRGYCFLQGNQYSYVLSPSTGQWTNSFVSTTTTATNAGGSPTVQVTTSTGMTNGDNFGIELDSGVIFWTTILLVAGTTITLNANVPTQASTGATCYDYTSNAQQPDVIETALLRDNQNNDIPLKKMNVQEYDELPTKTQATYISDPTAIYWETQLGQTTLYTDCAGAADTSKYIVLTYLEQIQDFNYATDNPEYPAEWYLALCWETAKQGNSMFRAIWTTDMEDNYKKAIAIAHMKEPERRSEYFLCGDD